MKFITESELRARYRKKVFTEFEMGRDTRLTPGGRQFISDMRIQLIEPDAKESPGTCEQTAKAGPETPDAASKSCLLAARLRSVENLFFETGYQFMDSDICLARDIMAMQPRVAAIRSMASGKNTDSLPINYPVCTEPVAQDFNQEEIHGDLEDCSEITAFHIQSPNGQKILMLDKLRCAMYELDAMVNAGSAPKEKKNAIAPLINQLINTLSRMICTAFGGK